MSTHRHFDKICCAVLAVTLLFTVFFVNAESFGIQKSSSASGYGNRLFDHTAVHTVDIVMDNWDAFIADCKNEEYYSCAVVIDGEVYKNVAIRAKGNTSLTQVESYGNDRYSFKIEFDHYDSSKTYYGLDKLCLNNIIQDNTYMKDYLAYQMMAQMGVASPLCSYVNITVNGEDWGLYLAVEGVEEAFLQRNYGKDYGELYKPDSMDLGGGRGNGEQFDMNGFWDGSEPESTDSANSLAGERRQAQQMPDDMAQNEMREGVPDGSSFFSPGIEEIFDGMMPSADDNVTENSGGMPQGGGRPDGMPGGDESRDDVLLKYIDDDMDSYSNIFENAKTDVSESDKKRLIESLKKLSAGETLDCVVDIEAVIRYFVVHNFLLNFDSYTGSMIHNYYLYEKDGRMQMIPWDYNLAFGGFQSMDSVTSLVNYPIDSPVSGGNVEDRPMIAWIFTNEEYIELYHHYFSEFISEWFEKSNFEDVIDRTSSMISPYVEKDPTKFCTYEEFEKGVSTLKEFCLLRAKSIGGQLNGQIGSTSGAQQSSELIDAGALQISDMGKMQNFMGGNMDKPNGGMQNQKGTTDRNGFELMPSLDEDRSSSSEQTSSNDAGGAGNHTANGRAPQMPNGQMPGENPPNRQNGDMQGQFPTDVNGQVPNTNGNPDETGQKSVAEWTEDPVLTWIWIIASAGALTAGIVFALVFRRRKS